MGNPCGREQNRSFDLQVPFGICDPQVLGRTWVDIHSPRIRPRSIYIPARSKNSSRQASGSFRGDNLDLDDRRWQAVPHDRSRGVFSVLALSNNLPASCLPLEGPRASRECGDDNSNSIDNLRGDELARYHTSGSNKNSSPGSYNRHACTYPRLESVDLCPIRMTKGSCFRLRSGPKKPQTSLG